MVTHEDNVLERVRILIEQYRLGIGLGRITDADCQEAMLDTLLDDIAGLYRDELPLARILDSSDLVIHAEGAAIKKEILKLRALNALTENANNSLVNLVANSFKHVEPKLAKKQLSIDVTGMAPGSLFIGTKIRLKDAPDLFEDEDQSLVENSLSALYQAISFIKDDAIDPEITDAIADPAMRDSTMIAALGLSPSGKQGISQIGIFSPSKTQTQVLTSADRKILRESIRKGIGTRTKEIKLQGEVREINLDTYRFVVKTKEDIVVRCLLSSLNKGLAQQLIGKQVVVRGHGEFDKNNNPRLVTVKDPSDILNW